MLHVCKYSRILLVSLPVVRISPEWVMNPEQVKSGGRTATLSLWITVFVGIYKEWLVKD
jgi:hypothetical protein